MSSITDDNTITVDLPTSIPLHILIMSLVTTVILPYSIYVANTRHNNTLYVWLDNIVQHIKNKYNMIDRSDLYVINNNNNNTKSDSWFHIHNIFTFISTLLYIIGIICVLLYNADKSLYYHFNNDLHHTVGYIIILLLIFIQPKLGTTTTIQDRKDRWKHHYLGYCIVLATIYCFVSGWGLLFDMYLPV